MLVVIGLILSVLLTFSAPSRAASQCTQVGLGTVCAKVVGQDVVVTLGGVEILRVKGPVGTVEVQVPVPGPTKLVPGPIRTIIVPQVTPVPGPTRTIIIRVPAPVQTVTVTPSPSVTPKLTPTAPGATLTATPGPQSTTKVVTKNHTITKTIKDVVKIGAVLLLAGILVALIALGVSYVSGYRDAERQEVKKLENLKDELF
jgi:hypothetical protein